jgi:hypothetical protein
MKYIILISIIILSGCKTTETIKYKDREVLVPKIVVEYCGVDVIKKCTRYIDNNKDLIECYIYNESKIDEANEIIRLCKEQTK